MSTLRIRLLGGFSLEHEGVVLPPLATRAARSLLALLVIQRDLPHSRDLLAGTFWPDLPEARARRRLSHALWQLQQLLKEIHGPAPFVVVEADTVEFNSDADFWLDVDEFERLGKGSLSEIEQAIELYRGDLLAGLYDDWTLLDRQELRRQYADLLRRATDGYKSRGEIKKALSFARRLVAHNPLAEEAQRDVMRLSFLLGDFNDAIQQYEFCASILEEELGARPAAETEALYAMIVTQRTKGDRPFVPDPRSPLFAPGDVPMVGRIDERGAVLERMAGAFAGRGGVALVEGSPGVGVSRFLAGLAEDAHWRGLGVLQATARSTGTPYELCRSALGEALSALRIEQLSTMVSPVWLNTASAIFASLAPQGSVPERLNPEDEGGRMAQALTELILGFGTISPHVVIMDDVHLADPETLAFLRQAARRLHSSNVLVILGYHSAEARLSEPVWEALQDIDAQRGTERLTLNDLDRVETAELARLASAGPIDDALLDALFVETGGNPLLVLEGLRDAARRDDSAAAPTLTDVASDLLKRRLRSAPPLTLRTLQGAAIYGGPISSAGIARVTGLSRHDVLAGVGDGIRKAFLIDLGSEVEFAHAQLRTATRSTIDSTDLAPMHAAAASWLESSKPERHEELAHHLLASGAPERAVAPFRDAARQAAQLFALDTASKHLKSAIAAAHDAMILDADVVEMLLDLEVLADQQGHREEQAGILERLLAMDVGPETRLEAMRRRVVLLGNTNRYDEADAVAVAALAFGREAGLPTTSVLAARGLALSWSGRPGDALPHLRRVAGESDLDAASEAETRYALGMALSSLDDLSANEELERSLQLFEEAGQPRRVADVMGLMATNDGSRGEVAVAEARFRQAFDICRRIGFTLGAGLHLTNLASLHYLEGRPAEALRGFDAALELLSIVPNNRHEAMTLNNTAFVRHRIVGDDAGAREAARRALDYYRSVDNSRGAAQACAILASIEARRDSEAALQLFAEEFDDVEAYGPWTAAHLRLRQAEVHLASGRLDSARHYCDEARLWTEHGDLSDILSSVERVSASIALAAGDRDEALLAARRSIDLLGRGVPQPYLHHFGLYLAAREHAEREAALYEAYSGLRTTLAGFSPAEQEQAAAVPVHAAIIEAWAARHPITRTIVLKEAPRPGTVEATLTVEEPEDRAIAGKRPRRLHRIKRILDEASGQSIALSSQDLAALLGVSPATIRRDLATIATDRS
ncbi:MAG: BTAD domain-containing putative transcriptional regulator [Acidimicrobiia bacterium]